MTLLIAGVGYALLWPLVIPDVSKLMIPWLLQVQHGGVWGGLSRPVGNYPPAYAYLLDIAAQLHGPLSALSLIKGIAVVSVGATALAAGFLLDELKTSRPFQRGALVLLLPSAALNGALIGQCDGFWVAPCLMAVAAALRRRAVAMLIWYGLAFAFKAQAIFLAPFVLCRLIEFRTPWRYWLVAPATTVASVLPAVAAGWPVGSLSVLYLGQVQQFPQLSFNAPNIWAVFMAFFEADDVALKSTIVCVSLLLTMWLMVAFLRSDDRSHHSTIEQSLLTALVTVGTLPLMHERYFLLADMLALVSALAAPSRRTVGRCVLVQIGSIGGILAFLSGVSGLAVLGAVPMILATASMIRDLTETSGSSRLRAGFVPT